MRTSLAAGLGALVAAACNPGNLSSAIDATSLVGGTAYAASPGSASAVGEKGDQSLAPGDLWKEHGEKDALPQGVVPMTSLAPLVKVLKPGVVNIYTTQVVRSRATRRGAGGGVDPFEEYFRRYHEGQGEESRRQSLGSGMILNAKGFVLTNNHVVEGADEIRIKLDDGREFEAEPVGRDPKTDVALLKLKPGAGEVKDLPIVYLGDSDKLEVGDFVIAAGNPFGLDHSVSLGIVSAKERVIGAGLYDDFIQTDAAINPGNSGGPLFNTRGEVVGVNTAIVAQGQGIGFAVPVNMVKALLPQLLSKGKVVRGWLGVSIQDVTPELARTLKLERARGALVAGVMKRSPAEQAGLKAGDVVVGMNGKAIETYNQLSREVAFIAPGAGVKLAVIRDGKPSALEVKLGQRPEDEDVSSAESGSEPAPAAVDRLGLTVQPVAPTRAAKLGLESGVQISGLRPDSAAGRAGARIGDVVVELQRQSVRTMQDYSELIASLKPGDTALLRLQRENASVYVAVRIPR
ncbi:MAG TPA: Do family serine endopeptidase [Myxococcales bacterium]|jgi:serine protease Do